MANLLGKPFEPYVNNQIRARQELHGKKTGRTSKELQYLNSRNAWVKMASGVSIEKERLELLKSNGNELLNGIYDGKNLALKNVLFGGLTSFGVVNKTEEEGVYDTVLKKQTRKGVSGGAYSRAYGVGGTKSFGYSPMPGIIDMNIRCLNRGSVKKMELNIKCHNREQFEIIDVLYLRLGYSVIVEWGYDKFLNNSGEVEDMGATMTDGYFWADAFDKSDYTSIIPFAEQLRLIYNGNYDAAFGVVSNFSWTFENDGTYNIKVQITSLGDVIESLRVNLPSTIKDTSGGYLSKKFSRLLESVGDDGNVEQNDFYKVLYQGLWESIERWWDSIFDGSFKPSTILKIQNITQKSKEIIQARTGMEFAKDFFPFSKGQIGTDHQFLDENGELYENPLLDLKGLGKDSGYDITQQEIRNAIEYAIAQWYSDEFPVNYGEQTLNNNTEWNYNVDSGRALKNIGNYFTYNKNYNNNKSIINFRPAFGYVNGSLVSTTSGYQVKNNTKQNYEVVKTRNANNQLLKKSLNNGTDYWKTLLGFSLPVKDLHAAPAFNYSGFATGNKMKNGTITGEFYNYSQPLTPGKGGIDTSANETVFNVGMGKQFLKDRVFQYFTAPKNITGVTPKATIAPNDPDLKTISELEKKQKEAEGNPDKKFSKQDENKLNNAKAARAQTVSDFKNQNKNRIYRFFYDVRIATPNTTTKGSQSNLNVNIVENEKVVLPGGGEVGKSLSIITDPSFMEKQFLANPVINLGAKAIQYAKKGINWLIEYGFGGEPEFFDEDEIDSEIDELEINRIKQEIEDIKETAKFGRNVLFLNKVQPIDNQYYIRLGFFLDWIQQNVFVKIDSSKKQPLMTIDTNTSQNVVYAIDNLVSLDMTKVLISNPKFISGLSDSEDENTAVSIPLFPNIAPYVTQLSSNSEVVYGQVMNAYFSFSRLQEIFDTTVDNDEVYLFDALKDICSDLNNCLGNINNIEPVVDENNVIHFIDQTTIPGIEEIAKAVGITDFTPAYTPEPLQVFGYDGNKSNFVRDIGLTTEISKEYATMITIGATANGAVPGIESTAFSRWNLGITDRFKNNLMDATDDEPKEPIKTVSGTETRNNYATLISETVGGNEGYGLFGLSKSGGEFVFNEDDIDFNRGIIADFYKLMQAQNTYMDSEDEVGNTIESSVGFLPFNLKLKLDGISGIKIYNKMNIQQRFLPSNYPNTLEFLITQVNHTLSNNQWVTDLETVATSKSVLTNKKKKK